MVIKFQISLATVFRNEHFQNEATFVKPTKPFDKI